MWACVSKKQVKQCEQLIGWQHVKLIYLMTSLPSDGITVNSCLFYHSDVIFSRWEMINQIILLIRHNHKFRHYESNKKIKNQTWPKNEGWLMRNNIQFASTACKIFIELNKGFGVKSYNSWVNQYFYDLRLSKLSSLFCEKNQVPSQYYCTA